MSDFFDVPVGIPQVHPTSLQRGFIRDCYPEHYDYLLELLGEGRRYIVVTGTPGIGKSMFYIYFFGKYRADNPDKKIVLASYSEEKELQKCMVWDLEAQRLETKVEIPYNEDGVLYLIDGVPNKRPSESCFTIFFTSPDIAWFVRMNKLTQLYREIYMPNWTSKEIQEANEALGLGIEEHVLKQRWQYFGGSPRYALQSDQYTVDQQVINVNTAIESVKRIEDVLQCFRGRADPNTVYHRLMHYDVKDDDMRKVFDRRLKFASNFIAYQVQESLDEKLGDNRRRLMMFLDGDGKPAAFLGWLFEAYAHEMLLKGVDLPMRGLNAQATETSFKLDETVGIYTKFKMAQLEQVFEDAYRQPDSSTLRSGVDAYYLTKSGVLWLFQMTRNVDHKVNVEGVLELLERLGKLEDTDNVNLVFVVPKGVAATFPVQQFKVLDVFRPDLSDEQVMALACDNIPGIKQAKKRKLNDDGMTSIGDVMTVKTQSPDRVSFIRSVLIDFEDNRRRNQRQQRVLQLKQYCISLDYAPPQLADNLKN